MTDSRELGQETYERVFGRRRSEPAGPNAPFEALTLDHLFGTIWSREGLSIRDRSLVTVSILAALGRDGELRAHLMGLRKQGLARNQFTELMIHVAHYAGWPAGHNALRIVHDLFDSYYEQAKGPDPDPAVLVFHDGWGRRPYVKRLCDDLSSHGFVVCAPDLYAGRIARDPAEAQGMAENLSEQQVDVALSESFDFAMSHPLNAGGRIGVIGFSLGGQLALYAASRLRDIGACAVFYPYKPNLQTNYPGIQCPVYLAVGNGDSLLGTPDENSVVQGLRAAAVDLELRVFHNVGHGFFDSDDRERFDEAAHRRAAAELLAFLKHHLT